jgi:hypothetical protein
MTAFPLVPLFGAAPASAAGIAQWNVLCGVDHFGNDDPIVAPRQPGSSHMHSFYGNTSTNAWTTSESLPSHSPSSCGRGMGGSDLSAYWIPSLYKKDADGTNALVKSGEQALVVYYRRAGGAAGPRVHPFPIGLRMIAGDATAISPQPIWKVLWSCGGAGPQTPHIPTCPEPGQPIHASLVFPSCWDGAHLDVADHQSHMTYAADNGSCPEDHPVSVPQVTFEVDYPGIAGGPSYSLASGGVYSFHGDFFAAWNSRVQNALIGSCLNEPRECSDMNRNGHTLFRPSYDPDPITIDLREFRASPPFVPAEAPITKGSTPPGTAHGQHPRAATGPMDQSLGQPIDGTMSRAGVTRLVVALIGFLGIGYLLYRFRRRRRTTRGEVLPHPEDAPDSIATG